ncbi:DUF421 domain-containing protein [Paraclostridium sordellii]|uniref:Membrane protein n=2 Tax=Paraclostridium sordellii TaxID=1505 RepID=A0A0C7R637_PARSO|nr:DUF421 domain-containing protein [Paeniclostridium sordellii]CEN78498.1 membrane protein [[Clostridium] sordellii] [Paeniclostridium sordellii]CEQ03594.1 membrane protein [[Clostridium] sordellii] [Paeniclostridium sordellii]
MINEIYIVSIKSIISVSILFILTKIMGKKQISQLTLFDYVVGISIGSIAAELAINESISYITRITGMTIYALFPILLSIISLKSYLARKILDGVPTILIQNGEINEKGLKKTKMNINDLIEECRLKDVFDIKDIKFAILETSGNLSIQLKSKHKPLTPEDINLKSKDKGLCVNLIIDGKILNNHLDIIGKDTRWLDSELDKKGIKNISDILLAYVDSSKKINVYLKNKDIPITPTL